MSATIKETKIAVLDEKQAYTHAPESFFYYSTGDEFLCLEKHLTRKNDVKFVDGWIVEPFTYDPSFWDDYTQEFLGDYPGGWCGIQDEHIALFLTREGALACEDMEARMAERRKKEAAR